MRRLAMSHCRPLTAGGHTDAFRARIPAGPNASRLREHGGEQTIS